MLRRIITIDTEKCNGCGLCARACHEGAIGMVEGKAALLREDYCDGLGDCLPACPVNAISFETREAPAYDELAVLAAKVRRIPNASAVACAADTARVMDAHTDGELSNFPIQIKLVPSNAAFFPGCDLLISADCCAYACGSFHERFMKDRVTVIGCPKLDGEGYVMKFRDIFADNEICSITVARMAVPCCGGLVYAVKKGLELAGKDIPLRVVTIESDGSIQK